MKICISQLGTLPDVSITGTTSTGTSITLNIGTIPSGIDWIIIGYHRLDLGVPVGEYVNNGRGSSRTFSSLVLVLSTGSQHGDLVEVVIIEGVSHQL